MQFKGVEKAKLDYVNKLFNEFSTSKVRYHEASCYDKLLEVTKRKTVDIIM